MRRILTWLLLPLSLFFGLAAEPRTLDVRAFGAKGDGRTVETEALNRAMAAAGREKGEVRFPPGRYLSGTIELRSGVTLHLEPGATLLGTTNLSDYKMFRPPAGTPEAGFKPEWHRALLLGVNVENVRITGGGIIDGNKVFDPKGEERMRGPHTILVGHGRNITIDNVQIRDSANYAILLEDCSDTKIQSIRVTGGWDGVHFRGWPDRYCTNVTITDSQFFTGDDAIAGRYWENVVIADCVLNSSCNGIRVIGPARKLMVNDCQFFGPGQYRHRTSNRTNMLAGIALQPGAWDPTTGPLDDVHLSDLTMQNVATPFHFALKGNNTVGTIEVTKVKAAGVYRSTASIESWTTNAFGSVTFRDMEIEFTGGGTPADAEIPIKAPGVDTRKLPVWGFFARNVNRLTLENVRLRLEKTDLRPVARFESVGHLQMNDFAYPKDQGVSEPIVTKAVGEIVQRP